MIVFLYLDAHIKFFDISEEDVKIDQHQSCLNNIYDGIFVITIPSRIKTYSLTKYQLDSENIKFIKWSKHSVSNPYSMDLYNNFRNKINKTAQNDMKLKELIEYYSKGTSVYNKAAIFLLRQNQIDIIKYAKYNGLKKILILEDDIILINTKYIKMFCKMEPYLPSWYVLNLGQNQRGDLSKIKSLNITKKNITNGTNVTISNEIKYYRANGQSFGAFSISFSFQIYDLLINTYDNKENNMNLFPFDHWHRFVKDNKTMISKCFNIEPSLFLPNVEKSSLRKSRDQLMWIKQHTINTEISYFSKYWDIVFNSNNKYLYNNDNNDDDLFHDDWNSNSINLKLIDNKQYIINDGIYPKYYYYSEFVVNKYFSTCEMDKGSWAKVTQSHYFMQQLKKNQFNKRVFKCNEADIFIIPLSLGNAVRGFCGNASDHEFVKEIQQLNEELFNNSKSCWNIYPKSRKTHFIMLGDYKARNDIKYNRLRRKTLYDQWIKHFLTADIDKNNAVLQKCTVPSGHVSILSLFDSAQSLSSSVVSEVNNSKYNNILWKDRKYNLFFMGQADQRPAYKMRRALLSSFYDNNDYNNNNILIETKFVAKKSPNTQYKMCEFTENADIFSKINKFPCWLRANIRGLYLNLLSNSKFNLMIRGDDSCSSRFWDAISLNVINIVISDKFENCLIGYNKHNSIIPWNKMFLWISATQFHQNPQFAIWSLLKKYTDHDFENMLQLIEIYKRHILWDIIDSQVSHDILYSALHTCPQLKTHYFY